MENKRVGVLGGSFDPPTYGHEKLGEVFLKALNLDEVRYVPARQNPLKTNLALATTNQRLQMLEMMVANHAKFSVSDIELADDVVYAGDGKYIPIKEQPSSYTYNTMKAFQLCEPHSEFIFLGGSDILKNFYQWHKAEEFIKEFKICIYLRPPHSVASTIAPIKEEHREKFYVFDELEMPDMSSTDVRSHFDSGKIERAKVLMRPDIYDYVLRRDIYSSNS